MNTKLFKLSISSVDDSEKVNISSVFFMLYLGYVLLITIYGYFNLFCYCLNWKQNSICSLILLSICCFFLFLILKPYFKIDSVNAYYSKEFIVFVFLLLVLTFFKIIYPDKGFDTFHYHLICQNLKFSNYFQDNCIAKGNFQIWGFCLADRLFFAFRKILGYRLGTILNTLVTFLCYFQVNTLLENLFPEDQKQSSVKKALLNKQFWSIFITLNYHVIMQLNSYYVDLLAIPFILEAVIVLISDKKVNQNYTFYFALLTGLAFAMKMTNVIYVFPLIILYIIKNRKALNFYQIVISGILVILPCFQFLIFNTLCTHNPVFPYYNKIFHSDYFSYTNFKDTRWGPTNFIEKLLWPFYMVINPKYRQSEISVSSLFMCLSVFSSIFYFIIKLTKALESRFVFNKLDYLFILMFISSLLWSITTGYQRYYIFNLILCGVFLFYLYHFFVVQISDNKCKDIVNFSLSICFTIFIGQLILNVFDYVDGVEWSWRHYTKESLKNEASLLLKDQSIVNDEITESTIKPSVFFLTSSVMSGFCELYNPYVYSVNSNYLQKYPNAKAKFDIELQKHSDLFNGEVYDVLSPDTQINEQYKDYLKQFGFEVDTLNTVSTKIGEYVFVKLKKVM